MARVAAGRTCPSGRIPFPGLNRLSQSRSTPGGPQLPDVGAQRVAAMRPFIDTLSGRRRGSARPAQRGIY